MPWSKDLKKIVCKKCDKSFWTNEDRVLLGMQQLKIVSCKSVREKQ